MMLNYDGIDQPTRLPAPYIFSYVFSIVAVNYAFGALPMIVVFGEHLPMATFLVGFVFVLRDYVQISTNKQITLLAIIFSCALSYLIAEPKVALASACAFLIGEIVDMVVFSAKPKWSFSKRILLSSLASTPIDSVVFLTMIGHGSFLGVVFMTLAKLAGATIVASLHRGRK
jgi:queuosine precursor transporter